MPARQRNRLDKLLVERGLAPSREKAEALIMAGAVLVNEIPVTKSGADIDPQAEIRLKYEPSRFVGRGGEKIDSIFDHFGVVLEGRTAIDVGASTGGFTDCMLQRGAARVYAVDVGYNQLALKLRQDDRVVVMERTHAKDLSTTMFTPRPTIATIDVSFIGLRKILPFVASVLESPFEILALVKPQFELEPHYVGKGGLVKEEKDQALAISLVEQFMHSELKLDVQGHVASPLRGEKSGNQEYFVYARSGPSLTTAPP